jgi:uncharacterized RDD family membrane protein YckC
MKCPKCGYIGFETTERCRNCGYDFSLAVERIPAPDFPLTTGEAMSPPVDLPLGPQADLAPGSGSRGTVDRRPEAGGPGTAPGSDLPLFPSRHDSDDDRPLITPSPTPRPPLAVRRSTPPAARPRTPRLDRRGLGLRLEPRPDGGEAPPASPSAGAEPVPRATAGRRLTAAAIDLLILGALDLSVLYFTLRLCRLAAVEVFILPVIPLLLFFLILNGGYLLAFTTAGGQTIGKMAVGIRVVAANDEPLTLRQAAIRTIGCILSVVPVGLGLVPFLFAPGQRALHDRLAGTWVVMVSTS